MSQVYLDNAATTPLDPRVLDAMLPYLREHFGNAASSLHRYGEIAAQAVDDAREQVAASIGARPKQIIFTSGATESDNLAIKGVARHYRDKGRHIITQATEHKAVLEPCEYLERKEGCRVTFLRVDDKGRIDLNELEDAICDDTILVSIMFANNEVGTVQPIAEIGRICKQKGVIFHTDAAQAFGKMPIDVEAMGIDLLSISGHKVYGPKGVGALYKRTRPQVWIQPLLHGGGHEAKKRSGTLNVPGIVGLGAAARIAIREMDQESKRLAHLRDRLWEGLTGQLDDLGWNGDPEHCLPNILNVSFPYVEGEALILRFKDVAVSSGSACTSPSLDASYVLRAMGVRADLAHGSLRFSLGRFTTRAEIEHTIQRVVPEVRHLREMSPLYEMVQEGIDLNKVEWAAK